MKGETAVKLTLLNTLNLYERYQLEERLLSVAKLDDTYPQDELPLPVQAALQIIVEIRRLAARLAGCTPKIEPDSKNPKYFLTVRGRGYKLDF